MVQWEQCYSRSGWLYDLLTVDTTPEIVIYLAATHVSIGKLFLYLDSSTL